MNTASQPKATSKQMKDQHEVTVITMPVPLLNFMAWISNHMPNEVLEDEITYALPNFNGTAVEVWEWVYSAANPTILGVKNTLFVADYSVLLALTKLRFWC